tara:strand:- start:9 stop:296 length:288 start_codon:yes stop_codon:yes gene_type:complete
MKRFLLAVVMLGFFITPAAASILEPNDQLYDECHTSLRKLEQMFMVYDDLSDLNPSIHVHIARMNMLINMVSLCSESGLMPMTETVIDKLKNKVM